MSVACLLRHVTSRRVMSGHMTSRHIVLSRYVMSVAWRRGVLRHVCRMARHAGYVMSHHVAPCPVMSA